MDIVSSNKGKQVAEQGTESTTRNENGKFKYLARGTFLSLLVAGSFATTGCTPQEKNSSQIRGDISYLEEKLGYQETKEYIQKEPVLESVSATEKQKAMIKNVLEEHLGQEVTILSARVIAEAPQNRSKPHIQIAKAVLINFSTDAEKLGLKVNPEREKNRKEGNQVFVQPLLSNKSHKIEQANQKLINSRSLNLEKNDSEVQQQPIEITKADYEKDGWRAYGEVIVDGAVLGPKNSPSTE